MEGLFNIQSILLHILNAGILFAALYFLLYKPVRKFMTAREQAVNDQIDGARILHEQAEVLLGQSQKKLDETDREIAEKLSAGQKRGEAQQAELIAEARAEGEKLMLRAQQESDTNLKNAHNSMKRQVADLAIDIAAAVLEREVKPVDHQQLVADFLKKVG